MTFLSGCTLPNLPWQTPQLGALQVTSVPKSTVFLNDKEVGKTPYYDEKLAIGEYTLRLTSDVPSVNSQWQAKVKIISRVLTVVSRDLGPSELLSSGHIISLEQLPDAQKSEISVISTPTGAQVNIDSNPIGQTPVSQTNVKQGEHSIDISLAGYKSRNVRIQTVLGYRLMLNVQLAQALLDQTSGTDASASAQLTATGSSQLTKPAAPAVNSGNLPPKPRIKVLDTPTGWLNVRSGPTLGSSIVVKINPGEYYPYLDEQTGWVKIKYNNGQSEGWVSSQYVEKQL